MSVHQSNWLRNACLLCVHRHSQLVVSAEPQLSPCSDEEPSAEKTGSPVDVSTSVCPHVWFKNAHSTLFRCILRLEPVFDRNVPCWSFEMCPSFPENACPTEVLPKRYFKTNCTVQISLCCQVLLQDLLPNQVA